MSKAPDNWFEDIYANGDASGKGIPWATREPAPLLLRWLDAAHPTGHGERAMVVGCGLGDDALEMARRGFTVTAFDVAETAIELARERFGDLPVEWHVGELFETPPAWSRAFDVVVEHRTIQSLPPQWQERGMRAIADLVAPGGTLRYVVDVRNNGPDAADGVVVSSALPAELQNPLVSLDGGSSWSPWTGRPTIL